MHDIALIVPTPFHYTEQRAEANARLIAAAPDLLAAAEAVLTTYDAGALHLPDAITALQEAVARARGTSEVSR